MALERMEANITAVLRNDMECIAAVHCLKVYCQRLGCDLADGAAVRRAVGCAFALATEALSDMAVLQFPPSLTAAAILVAARRAQARPPPHPPYRSTPDGQDRPLMRDNVLGIATHPAEELARGMGIQGP